MTWDNNFEWHDYKNENGGVARLAVVQEPTEIESFGAQVVPVKPGDVIAHTGTPNRHAYHGANLDGWTRVDSEPVEDDTDDEVDDEEAVDEVDDYDPTNKPVGEVQGKLNDYRESGDRGSFDAVIGRETSGKNRPGITSQTF